MLHSVEKELEVIARSTAELAGQIGKSLSHLSVEGAVRTAAAHAIAVAVQDIFNIEARCMSLALAIRQYALLPTGVAHELVNEIWQSAGVADDTASPREVANARIVDLDDLGFGSA